MLSFDHEVKLELIHVFIVRLVRRLQVGCLLVVHEVLFEDLGWSVAALKAILALLTGAGVRELDVEWLAEAIMRVQTRHVLHEVLAALGDLHNIVTEPFVVLLRRFSLPRD